MAKAKTVARPRPGREKAGPVRVPPKVVDALDARLAATQRGVLAGVVVLVAVAVWRPLTDPFMLPKLAVLTVGVILLLVLAAVRAVRAGRITVPAGPVVLLLAVLAGALVLATVTSDNVALSFFGRHKRYAGLLSYLLYIALFLVAVRMYAARQLRGLVSALFLALALVVAYGLVQVAGADPYSWSSDFALTFSTMGNVNFASGFVGMLVPVVAAVVVLPGWSPAWRYGGIVLLLASAAYLALNGSSQGPVAAAAGLSAVALAWVLARRGSRSRWKALPADKPWLLPAAGLVAVIGVVVLAARVAPGLLDGFSERRYFWRASLGIFADRPFLGAGLDSFRDLFPRYRAPEHGVLIGFDGADSPHNLPLGMLAAGGLPLAVSYLAFVGYTGWVLLRGLLASAPDRLPLLAAFGGMWTAYQVQSLVSVDVPGVTFVHFLSAAVVFALARPLPSASLRLPLTPAARGSLLPKRPPQARVSSVLVLGVVLLLAAALLWQGLRPLRADLAAADARGAVDPAARVTALDEAVRLAPWDAEYRLLQGRALIEAGDTTRAYDSALAAAQLRPGSSKLALGVADFAKKRGDQATADGWVDEALRRDPNNPRLLEEVAGIVRSEGETQRADELEQRAASLRANHADY